MSQGPSAIGLTGGPKFIRHQVASRNAFDRLNTQAALPIAFRATGRDVPQIDIRGVLTPRLAIWTVGTITGFESAPAEGLDHYSLRIPLRGGLIRRTGGHDHEMRVGEATILPVLDLRASRFHPGSEILGCSIAAADVLSRHEALEGDGTPLQFHTLAKIEGLRLRALVDTIRRVAEHVGTEAEALTGPLLLDVLINQLLSVWPRDTVATPVGSERILARATGYIEAHLADALTVGAVAAAAGVGVRTLQMAFRAQTGRTPLGYILDRRIESVHADLVANDGRLQVSQIAYRWGFLHMGEFARRYRNRYGCSPSQTGRSAA